MKTIILYSLVIITTEICQVEISAQKRVIGGANVEPGNFPFIVSLRRYKTNEHFCGASIISKRVLLTAAHCLCLQIKYADLYVVAGTIFAYENREGSRYKLENSICHENWTYDEENNISTNDIALALVNDTIIYTRYVHSIKLSHEDVPVGAKITLVGYGCTTFEPWRNLMPIRLQVIKLNVISNSLCKTYYDYIDERDMCTHRNYSNPDRGGCYGDSGSPVNYNKKQVGVYFNADENIPRSRPDIHVRVTKFLSWIKKNKRLIMLL